MPPGRSWWTSAGLKSGPRVNEASSTTTEHSSACRKSGAEAPRRSRTLKMADENNKPENGEKTGLLDKAKKVPGMLAEDVKSLKGEMTAKVKEQVEGLKDPTRSQVFTSIFR